MVSTRGVKLKFFENERVLCYEPDPTKAKVLYDSKVLDIVTNKDSRGKKSIEYLIHFQGWNSSWDRCVGEEYVLKDTPENRQLQKDLAQKSQLQLGAYLYRRERKKHTRKNSDRNNTVSEEDGSSNSPVRLDTDDCNHEASSTSDDDDSSSIEDDVIPIELTSELREVLEHDFYLINTKQKLLKLPAVPNVVTILESYWRHYVTRQFCGVNEKSNGRFRFSLNNQQLKLKPEEIQRNLNVCREVLDGIRVYFDFTLTDLLLYKSEHGQIPTMSAKCIVEDIIKTEQNESLNFTTQNNYDHYTSSHSNNHSNEGDFNHNDTDLKRAKRRRRTLRSNANNNTNETQANGDSNNSETSHAENNKASSSSNSHFDKRSPLEKALSWRLLPEHVYNQQPLPPSLVYGATHLTRLLVKLPEILSASIISEDKIKLLLRHFDSFIYFLSERKEWFGEKYYVDVSEM